MFFNTLFTYSFIIFLFKLLLKKNIKKKVMKLHFRRASLYVKMRTNINVYFLGVAILAQQHCLFEFGF